MQTNIQNPYNIFEAARINKVPVVIFASTNHITCFYEKEIVYTTPDMPVRPNSMYGFSKACGEAMCRHYHDQYGLSVYCIPIANYPDTDEVNCKYMAGENRWLSARHSAELTACRIEAPRPQFGIFYGVSQGADTKWDISNAKELIGWQPQDRGAPSP